MKNTISKINLYFAILTTFMAFQACKKDSAPNPDEQELITTVKITATAPDGNKTDFKWQDTDGAGGNNPVIDTIRLDAATLYNVEVTFLDESKTPVADITSEIKGENEAHLILMTPENSLNVQIISLDKDDKNLPLGLKQTLQTNQQEKGAIKLTLLHEPDKTAANPSATGETDIEVFFPVIVK